MGTAVDNFPWLGEPSSWTSTLLELTNQSAPRGHCKRGSCSTVPADACGSVRLFWMPWMDTWPDRISESRIVRGLCTLYTRLHIFILLSFDLHDPNPGLVLVGFCSSSSSSSSSSVTFNVITYTYHRLFHDPNPVAYSFFSSHVILL